MCILVNIKLFSWEDLSRHSRHLVTISYNQNNYWKHLKTWILNDEIIFMIFILSFYFCIHLHLIKNLYLKHTWHFQDDCVVLQNMLLRIHFTSESREKTNLTCGIICCNAYNWRKIFIMCLKKLTKCFAIAAIPLLLFMTGVKQTGVCTLNSSLS